MAYQFLLEQAAKKHPFPCPTSYRTALSYYVDITSTPRTNVLRELADHASDPAHRDFLLEITSATEEGKVYWCSTASQSQAWRWSDEALIAPQNYTPLSLVY